MHVTPNSTTSTLPDAQIVNQAILARDSVQLEIGILSYTKIESLSLYFRTPKSNPYPVLAVIRFFSFAFFSFQILYALLLNHKTSKSNFCVKLVVELPMQFCLPKIFGATLPGIPQKNYFFGRLKLGCHFFVEVSKYLTDKYFDTVCSTTPKWTSKNQLF